MPANQKCEEVAGDIIQVALEATRPEDAQKLLDWATGKIQALLPASDTRESGVFLKECTECGALEVTSDEFHAATDYADGIPVPAGCGRFENVDMSQLQKLWWKFRTPQPQQESEAKG